MIFLCLNLFSSKLVVTKITQLCTLIAALLFHNFAFIQPAFSKEIASLICHLKNEEQSSFIQLDASVETNSYSFFWDNILSDDVEVFKSRSGVIVVTEGAIFSVSNEKSPSNALLNDKPAKIDCFGLDFENIETALLQRYNVENLPLLEAELEDYKTQLTYLRSQMDEQRSAIALERQDNKKKLESLLSEQNLIQRELQEKISSLSDNLNKANIKTERLEASKRQLSLKMAKFENNYFPYPDLRERVKSELYKPFVSALNRCWVEPKANSGDVIAIQITHKTNDLEQNFAGVAELIAVKPGDVNRILQQSDSEGQNLTYSALLRYNMLTSISLSHENIRDAAVSALLRCRSDIYIPVSDYFSEVWLMVSDAGFQHIRW